jgi:hypothetical protein
MLMLRNSQVGILGGVERHRIDVVVLWLGEERNRVRGRIRGWVLSLHHASFMEEARVDFTLKMKIDHADDACSAHSLTLSTPVKG